MVEELERSLGNLTCEIHDVEHDGSDVAPWTATQTMQGTTKMLAYHQFGNPSLVVVQVSLTDR